MSTPLPDRSDPDAHTDDLVEPDGTNAGGLADAPPPAEHEVPDRDEAGAGGVDVRGGGHPEAGPRSLAGTEAKWHEHELAGESWDDPDRL